jgi:molybdopterin-guanine dinucleotide biosynthesis protein A
MGRDKAGLRYQGGTLAGAVARAVESAAGSAILIGNPELGGIADLYPGEGPLGGILTALQHTSAEWNLIVACDMPEITPVFLRGLLDHANEAEAQHGGCDVLLPYSPNGRPEPLCAVYRRSVRETVERHFTQGVRKVTAALEGVAVVRLDVAEALSFQNVNTPEDWAVYAAE